jgi:hypothetical protein
LVTISFVPDGTNIAGYASTLFSTFDSIYGSASAWQNIILKAAQQWAQQTNINFAVVSDNGTAEGGGNYQQGDPAMGDIRISAISFGTTDLASTNMPPPVNNYSIAGDITFNTDMGYSATGKPYDLQTVALHEFGHALGLDHSAINTAAMFPTYFGFRRTLTSDDIGGIRNIYSGNNPRTPDAYYGGATPNNSFTNAANLSSLISPGLAAVVQPLDITTAGEVEYFKVTAPAGSSSTFSVTAQSSGLSLLAPVLKVYNSSEVLVGSSSGAGHYGTTLTVTVNGVTAGEQFYVTVAGADSTSLGTGAYALTLNFGTGSPPAVALPNTQTLNGNPLHSGGGLPEDTPTPITVSQGQVVLIARADTAASSAAISAGAAHVSSAVVVTMPVSPTVTIHGQSVTEVRQESGGGDLDVLAATVDLPAQQPDDNNANLVPLLGASNETRAPATTDAASWREASTACFAADNTSGVALKQVESPTSAAEAGKPGIDPEAGLAGMALLLGSYWARQKEAVEEERAGKPSRARVVLSAARVTRYFDLSGWEP